MGGKKQVAERLMKAFSYRQKECAIQQLIYWILMALIMYRRDAGVIGIDVFENDY